MAGIVGGCLGIEPISAGGASVIRIKENVNESVIFPTGESIVESISETVTIQIT